jgi:hypothetical protein
MADPNIDEDDLGLGAPIDPHTGRVLAPGDAASAPTAREVPKIVVRRVRGRIHADDQRAYDEAAAAIRRGEARVVVFEKADS